MPSKRVYTRKKKSIQADGSRSYQLWSRDCVLKLVTTPVCLHIFWSMAQRSLLPTDVVFRAPRVENYDEEQATAVRTEDVDRAEEECLITCVRIAKYLEGLRRYYNRNVKSHSFTVGDLVLRRKQKTEGLHKLSSPWEGPYIIKEVTQPGSYCLCDLDGIDVPNSWHIEHLICFYP